MNRFRHAATALTLCVLGLNISALPAYAANPAPAAKVPDTVRPEVGTPLQAAQNFLKDKKYQEALAKLDEINKIANKTPYETYSIDRTRLAIAFGMGDNTMVIDSLQAVIASGRLSADEQQKFTGEAGARYFGKGDYPQAIEWFKRYAKEGGTDPRLHDALVKAYYLNNDFENAGKELQADVAAVEQAGKAPTEEQLRILFSISAKQKDMVGYVAALEKLVVYYPKKDYWNDLLSRMRAKPTFSRDLYDLDFYRLKFAMGLMSKTGEFSYMAEQSMQDGFPGEAKKVLDAGFKAGILGVGPDSDLQKSALAKATQQSTADMKNIDKIEADVRKSKKGIGLFNLGYTFVIEGQFDKGIALMEQGIGIGGLKHPEQAKFRLGVAYAMAGKNQNAIDIFKTIQGGDGSGDLARYWTVLLNHPLPPTAVAAAPQ